MTRRLARLGKRAEELASGKSSLAEDDPDRMKPEAPADPRVWGRAVFSGPGDEIQELSETFDFMERRLRAYVDGLREARASLSSQKRLLSTVHSIVLPRQKAVEELDNPDQHRRSHVQVGLLKIWR